MFIILFYFSKKGRKREKKADPMFHILGSVAEDNTTNFCWPYSNNYVHFFENLELQILYVSLLKSMAHFFQKFCKIMSK